MSRHRLEVAFPPELIEAIAQRAVELWEQRTAATAATPYLTVDETAAYLRCTRQAVHDRVHAGRLKPHRDGRRLLFHRDELDAYLTGGAS